MNKIESHLSLIVINILLIIINFNLLAFNAYPNDSDIPLINIICTLVVYIIWIVYGFIMGKKSRRDFLYFIFIYLLLSCIFMVLSHKLNNSGIQYFFIFIIAVLGYLPLCPISLLIHKFIVESPIIELTIPITLLISLSFISYFIGRYYKKNISCIKNAFP